MKNPKIYLNHILISINKIEGYTKGMKKLNFIKNNLICDAVVRNIEIIGEAVKNLPMDFRKKYNYVPWKDIAGMRDRIVHFYFGIDYNLVWEVVVKDLPRLKKQIEHILEHCD